jgi:hypothetical protein
MRGLERREEIRVRTRLKADRKTIIMIGDGRRAHRGQIGHEKIEVVVV